MSEKREQFVTTALVLTLVVGGILIIEGIAAYFELHGWKKWLVASWFLSSAIAFWYELGVLRRRYRAAREAGIRNAYLDERVHDVCGALVVAGLWWILFPLQRTLYKLFDRRPVGRQFFQNLLTEGVLDLEQDMLEHAAGVLSGRDLQKVQQARITLQEIRGMLYCTEFYNDHHFAWQVKGNEYREVRLCRLQLKLKLDSIQRKSS